MLLKSYRKEIVRPECRPEAESLHAIAHLDQDITEVIPYLNAVLGGFQYLKDPPSVSFKVHGKLIAVHPQMICVNALRDEDEGDKIIEWLKEEINAAWERRQEIQPRFEGAAKPKVIEILKLLPKTNCGECGQPTCMVFATQAAEGGREADDCPPLTAAGRTGLPPTVPVRVRRGGRPAGKGLRRPMLVIVKDRPERANAMAKRKILFLCSGNSCRSQMAEGWTRHLKGDVLEPYSAGIQPHGIDPRAVAAMAEAGVDMSHHRS